MSHPVNGCFSLLIWKIKWRRAVTLRGAHKTCHRECSVIPSSLVQQTRHTNVCNPAVRLKSMTFCSWWCLSWFSCWSLFFFFKFLCDDGKENKSQPLLPPLVAPGCGNSGIRHLTWLQIFTFLLPKVPQHYRTLTGDGHWYANLSQSKSKSLVHKYGWDFK